MDKQHISGLKPRFWQGLLMLIAFSAHAQAPPPPPGYVRPTPNRWNFDIKLHRHDWRFGVYVKF